MGCLIAFAWPLCYVDKQVSIDYSSLGVVMVLDKGRSEECLHNYSQEMAIHLTFPVLFTENFTLDTARLLEIMGPNLDRVTRVLPIVDTGVEDCWPNLEQDIRSLETPGLEIFSPMMIPGGEACKNSTTYLSKIYETIADYGIDRHSYILCFGGGAVLDLVGYAAATAHRGIRLIRFPTTVLAQNDSGVGVKNGINFLKQKNFLGTFAPPYAVVCDRRVLETLSKRDRIAGIAEAIKVALIKDRQFFEWLEEHSEDLSLLEDTATSYMVRKGAEHHMHHIAHCGDPFEQGNSRPLDFGHWSAHRLEVMTENRLRHGEAVAIGMALDSYYSWRQGFIHYGELDRIITTIRNIGLPIWDDALEWRDEIGDLKILKGLEQFREHLGGRLSISLLKGIGSSFEVSEMDCECLAEGITWLQEKNDLEEVEGASISLSQTTQPIVNQLHP